MSKAKKLIPVLLLLAAAAAVICGVTGAARYAMSRWLKVSFHALPSNETAEVLNNPYRGFYNMHGFRLADEGEPLRELDRKLDWDGENRLVMIEINLNNYADREISEAGLEEMDTVLRRWSEAGKRIILRVLYDWNGHNRETEPQDFDTILTHMDQTAEIINKYQDYVFIMQGIFIGDYGEMHTSKHITDENVRTLCRRLDSVIDPSIFLSVRTPWAWRTVTGLEDAPENFPQDGSLVSRLGLFNDGMLGSYSDLGTYPAGSETNDTRKAGIDFQNRLCQYVPNGGEVCIDNYYNDFENAIKDLRDMHVSYLNRDYDRKVFEKWRNSVYSGGGCFDGVDGYTYIQEHLGYRYAIRSDRIEFDPWKDEEARLSCTLQNVGFASCLRRLDVSAVIKARGSGVSYEIPADYDLRDLKSGKTCSVRFKLPVREYEKGEYDVYLKVTDPVSGEIIGLASDLERNENGYKLGSFELSPLLDIHFSQNR